MMLWRGEEYKLPSRERKGSRRQGQAAISVFVEAAARSASAWLLAASASLTFRSIRSSAVPPGPILPTITPRWSIRYTVGQAVTFHRH